MAPAHRLPAEGAKSRLPAARAARPSGFRAGCRAFPLPT
jgi:hypothetical protein